MTKISITVRDLTQYNVSAAVQGMLLDNLVQSAKNFVGNDPAKIKQSFINEVLHYYMEAKHLNEKDATTELNAMLPAELESWYRNLHMYDYNGIQPIGIARKKPEPNAVDTDESETKEKVHKQTPEEELAQKYSHYMMFTHVNNKLDPAQAICNQAKNYIKGNGIFKETDPVTKKEIVVGPRYEDAKVGLLLTTGTNAKGEPQLFVRTIDLELEPANSKQEKAK